MSGFIINVMIAITFVITGHWTLRKPSKEINPYYGYRTKRSRASQEAWDFAQKFSSEWLVKTGYYMGIISTLFLLLPNNTLMLIVATIFATIGCIVPIYLTEGELKRKFDNE